MSPCNLEAIQRQIQGARLQLFEGGRMFLVQDKSAHQEIIAFLSQ